MQWLYLPSAMIFWKGFHFTKAHSCIVVRYAEPFLRAKLGCVRNAVRLRSVVPQK